MNIIDILNEMNNYYIIKSIQNDVDIFKPPSCEKTHCCRPEHQVKVVNIQSCIRVLLPS